MVIQTIVKTILHFKSTKLQGMEHEEMRTKKKESMFEF
jgi:hypothetical protein